MPHGLGDRESLCRSAALLLRAATLGLMQFLSCTHCCPVNLSLAYSVWSVLFIYCSRAFKFSMFHNGKCIQFHTIFFQFAVSFAWGFILYISVTTLKNRHCKILRTDIKNPNKWSCGYENTEKLAPEIILPVEQYSVLSLFSSFHLPCTLYPGKDSYKQ